MTPKDWLISGIATFSGILLSIVVGYQMYDHNSINEMVKVTYETKGEIKVLHGKTLALEGIVSGMSNEMGHLKEEV